MHASLRYLAVASLIATSIACGEKGTFRPLHGEGSAGSGSGTGGEGGSADAPVGELIYGFDEEDQGWDVTFSNAASGIEAVDESDVELDWTEEGGNPGGVLVAEIPYSSKGQYVSFGVAFKSGEEIDLSGKIVSADVKILSGVGTEADLSSSPAGAKIYAKSGGDFVYANGGLVQLKTIGTWTTIYFDVEDPAGIGEKPTAAFDPSLVREFGIQVDTSGTSTTARPGVVLFDNIRY